MRLKKVFLSRIGLRIYSAHMNVLKRILKDSNN